MKKATHPTNIAGKVLMFLAQVADENWATWGPSFYMPTVQSVFKVGTSEKLQFRFMRRLHNLGLVHGCLCGCRGDFVISQKGIDYLAENCLTGERLKEKK